MPHPLRRLLLSALLVASLTSPAWADVTRVAIASRTVVANGLWFGAAGPYEKIAGTVFFELDPADPHNRRSPTSISRRATRAGASSSRPISSSSRRRIRRAPRDRCCSRFRIAATRDCLPTFNRATAIARSDAARTFRRRPADAQRLHAGLGRLGVRCRPLPLLKREGADRDEERRRRSSRPSPRHSWSTRAAAEASVSGRAALSAVRS